MKRITALALAVVVAFSLSGCTVFNTFISAGDEALLSTDLDALVDDLSKVAGIDAVDYELVIQGDMSYTVSVKAYATDLSEDAAQNAFARVTDTFASGRFPEQQQLSFWVGPGAESSSTAIGVAEWFDYPSADIPDEITRLYQLQDAVGAPLALTLNAGPDVDPEHERFISSEILPVSVDWAALRRMSTDAEPADLNFGRVAMTGGVIPSELERLAAQVAATDGLSIDWVGARNTFDLYLQPSNLEHGGDYASLDEWPALVKLVTVANSGNNGFSWLAVADAKSNATVNADDCDDTETTENDLKLQKQLAAEGIALAAGYCVY